MSLYKESFVKWKQYPILSLQTFKQSNINNDMAFLTRNVCSPIHIMYFPYLFLYADLSQQTHAIENNVRTFILQLQWHLEVLDLEYGNGV